MAEESRNTQSSLVSEQLGIIFSQSDDEPVAKSYSVSITILLLAFFFLGFGLAELITNYEETHYEFSFSCNDNKCTGQTNFINFQSGKKIYYYLINQDVSQNDISKELEQAGDSLENCKTYTTNSQGNKTVSVSGNTLVSSQELLPCGKYVSYFPGSTFKVMKASSSQEIAVISDDLDVLGISYTSFDADQSWVETDSEYFRVWNQNQIFSYTYKFWGYSNQLEADNYTISIESTNPISSEMGANLKMVLSDNGALFGNNMPLCIFNFVGSGILFLLGTYSCWFQQKLNNQKVLKNQRESTISVGILENDTHQ